MSPLSSRIREFLEFSADYELRKRPRLSKRYLLYHAIILLAVVLFLFEGKYLVPVLFGVYLASELPDLLKEFRCRRRSGDDPNQDTTPSAESSR